MREVHGGGKECTLKMADAGDLFCCDAAAFEEHRSRFSPADGRFRILRMSKKAYSPCCDAVLTRRSRSLNTWGNRLNEAQERTKTWRSILPINDSRHCS